MKLSIVPPLTETLPRDMRTLSRDRKIRPDEGLRRKEGSRQSEWGEPAIELENLFKEIAGFVASPSRPRQSSS